MERIGHGFPLGIEQSPAGRDVNGDAALRHQGCPPVGPGGGMLFGPLRGGSPCPGGRLLLLRLGGRCRTESDGGATAPDAIRSSGSSSSEITGESPTGCLSSSPKITVFASPYRT